MKQSAEFQEFDALVEKVLSVPREEMQRREAEYRVQVDANPRRRGPKRGSKRKIRQASSSHDAASSR